MSRKSLLFATTMLAFSWAIPMVAQAADAAAANTAMEEVVVTARRVEERLQTVPISIEVFNQQQLDNRNVVSAKDLATYTPSLSVNQRYGTEQASFSIRGFAQEQRTTPSVAVYFADVVAPRGGGSSITTGDGAGPGAFFDLQNAQVLKGPQGTLFGRNTTGGAILLVPRKPTGELGGYVEGSVGDYDMWRIQGVLNLPISENVRLRLGVDHMSREGYEDNLSGIGPSHFADVNYVAARASLIVNITDDIENYTVGSYTSSDTNSAIPKITRCFPAVAVFGNLACAQVAREKSAGFFGVGNIIPDPYQRMEEWQIINTTTYDVTDHLRIKNIVSSSELTNKLRTAAFGADWIIGSGIFAGQHFGFIPILHAPGVPTSGEATTTEELQFQGNELDGTLHWQGGVYSEFSDPLVNLAGNENPSNIICPDLADFQCSNGAYNTVAGSPRGSVSRQVGRTSYRDFAAYGQGSYDLTDDLKFTGGLRYTDDYARATSESWTYTFPTPNVPKAACTNNPLNTAGPARPVLASDCLENFRQHSHAITYLVDLDYKLTSDTLLYAKYSRGYRQGNVNPYSAAGFQTYRPEHIDAYEAGAKTSWQGPVPGLVDFAAYYNDLTDMQIAEGWRSPTGVPGPNTSIINAGKARTWGFELDASIKPFEGLRIDVDYTFLDTLIQKLTLPVAPAGAPLSIPIVTNAAGWRLPFAPQNKGSLTATYTLPVPDGYGTASVAVTYSYTDEYLVVTNFTDRGIGIIPPVSLLNLNLNWDSVWGSPVDLSVFATNVTNRQYFTHINDQSTSGFVSKLLGEPQMFGVRLRYRFGSDAG